MHFPHSYLHPMFYHTEKTVSCIYHSEITLTSPKSDVSNGCLLIALRAAHTSPPTLPDTKYFTHTSIRELVYIFKEVNTFTLTYTQFQYWCYWILGGQLT